MHARVLILLMSAVLSFSCRGMNRHESILCLSGVQPLGEKMVLDDGGIVKYLKKPVILEEGITHYRFIKTTYFIDWSRHIFVDKISDMQVVAIIVGSKYYYVDLDDRGIRRKGLVDEGSITARWDAKSLVIKEYDAGEKNYRFTHIMENDDLFLTAAYHSSDEERICMDDPDNRVSLKKYRCTLMHKNKGYVIHYHDASKVMMKYDDCRRAL